MLATEFLDVPMPAESHFSGMKPKSALKSVSAMRFLSEELPQRKMLVEPIIPEQGIVMLYAPRGVGKTNISLTLATCASLGLSMFDGRWRATERQRVLYIDGEMSQFAMQERLQQAYNGFHTDIPFDRLELITPDRQDLGMPDLSTKEGQDLLEPLLNGVQLVVVDNISCLFRSGRENDADSWVPIQQWALSLRKRNISLFFVHHANKTGGQRGSNKKEDIMDTVIRLQQGKDYSAEDSVMVEVHYDKSRGFWGEDAKSFGVQLDKRTDYFDWRVYSLGARKMDDPLAAKLDQDIIALCGEGKSYSQIAEMLGTNKTRICKVMKRHAAEG